MALTAQRKAQIEASIRSLQSRVQNEPNLQADLDKQREKLKQDTEQPSFVEIGVGPPMTGPGSVTGAREEPFFEIGTGPPMTGPGAVTPEGAAAGSSSGRIAQLEQKNKEEIRKRKEAEAKAKQSEQIRVGAEINIGEELEELRRSNESFRAALGDELGIAGFDDTLAQFENQQNLLIDRTDEDTKRNLTELADAKKTGVLTDEEFKQKLSEIVKVRGRAPEALTGVEEEEPPTPPEVPTEALEEEEVEEIEVIGENLIRNNLTGVVTYTDPKSGITFSSNPDTSTVDFSKLTELDDEELDAYKLLRAEKNFTLAQIAKEEEIEDIVFDKMIDLIDTSAEASRLAISEIVKAGEATARLTAERDLDDIAFRERELAIERAETFEDMAESEAKMDGYLKGKLSAYGAGKSTAALAIMSANTVKFAKLRSRASTKFSLEANRLQTLASYTKTAFVNSIVELKVRANADQVTLANKTQENIISLVGQRLKSSAQKDREKLELSLGYLKGVKAIKDAELKAILDAANDAHRYAKDNVQMAKWMSDQTGTIWDTDGAGQLYDTFEETFDAKIEKAKLAQAWARINKDGTSEGGLTSDDIVARIEKMRETGTSEQEIANQMEPGGNFFGTSAAERKASRFALDYLNKDRGDELTSTVFDLPFVSEISNLFGINISTQRDDRFIVPEDEKTPLVSLSLGDFFTNIPK